MKGFAIAGADNVWVAAARIEEDRVVQPVAVRYGWADNPPCSLYSAEKLPEAPFRSDDG